MRSVYYYFEESAKLILLYFLFLLELIVKLENDCFYFANNGCLSDSSTKAIIGMSIAMGIEGSTIYKIGLPSIRTANSQPCPSTNGIAHRKLPQFEILIVLCCLEH
jgi:hypothetical protein